MIVNGYNIAPYVNLYGAVLRGADLRGADLRGANLHDADLSWADLSEAKLYGADLRGADLRGANLHDADLSWANLYGANLRDANLYGANLRDANLYGAKNIPALPQLDIIPAGDILVYKKVLSSDKTPQVITLLIPREAKRSSATTRKCRAEYAIVKECKGIAYSQYDPTFTYEQGKTVRPSIAFNENRWSECSTGIHFFLTKAEAEEY